MIGMIAATVSKPLFPGSKAKARLLLLSLSSIVWMTTPAWGQQSPSTAPAAIAQQVEATAAPPADTVITAQSASPIRLTIPSLWWADDQFGGRLVTNWMAYPSDGTTVSRVDVIVNRQLWSLLNYLERYEFVNHFGIAAAQYGYGVRLLDRPNLNNCVVDDNTDERDCAVELAAYTCNSAIAPLSTPSTPEATTQAENAPTCRIQLRSSGRDSFGGRPTNSTGEF